MKIFSNLPVELINIILEYDGKIICPKMYKSLQDDIINYYKNTDKYVVYHYDFYPRTTNGLLSLFYYGSTSNILINGKDLIVTYSYSYNSSIWWKDL